MSSWFSADALKGLTETVQKSVDSVKEAIPENLSSMKIDNEMLSKLTLTSPELAAERARIDEEEKRKEKTRNMLAGMLPWETRDPDRDILVEECREAILKLSGEVDTFYEPFPMPRKNVMLEQKKSGEEGEEEEAEEPDEDDSDSEFERAPSAESLARLEKLNPLPPLLEDFDLNCHVGLIEKVLKEDPNLVEMQSKLSGGGERELAFWKNYFFNCAYTRYEAGLSLDELWSEQTVATEGAPAEEALEEDTITFDDGEGASESPPKAFSSDPKTELSNEVEKAADTSAGASAQATDFELIDDSENVADDVLDSVDYELDELEAEIAAELED